MARRRTIAPMVDLAARLTAPRRLSVLAMLALAVAGCGLERAVVGGGGPVPPGPLGPILPAQNGGPPLECRGVPPEMCQSFGNVDQANVVRVIVTCTETCTDQGGSVRIDVLRPDGTTESMGDGSYSSAPQPGAPQPGPAQPVPPQPADTGQPEY